MKQTRMELSVRFARRIPDPITTGAERHVFLCPVESLPPAIPTDPNPRGQNVDRGIWREIRLHLMNERGTENSFHLKNKGITIIASKVERINDNAYRLTFSPGDGIVDGAHTYKLLVESREDIREHNADNVDDPIKQFVKIEALTGLSNQDLVTDIAGGLNTAVQVQKMSLENLKGSFDWIKEELKKEPYFDEIDFMENEGGKWIDVRDVLVLLDMFNVRAFPNDGGPHPIRAYVTKAVVLDAYMTNPRDYQILRPILRDIMVLHDTICYEAQSLYNETGGKAGNFIFVEKRKRGSYVFPCLRDRRGQPIEGPYRLATAAAYPILAAFRWCVEIRDRKAVWTRPFGSILALWRGAAAELIRATQDTSVANGRKANAIGRSPMHWANLHNIIAKHSLMMKAS